MLFELAACALVGCEAGLSGPLADQQRDSNHDDAMSDAYIGRDGSGDFDAWSAVDAGRDAQQDAQVDSGLPPDPVGTWRSEFFPRDWQPVHQGGSTDAQGRFIPDFSFAGWHRGEARPPIGEALGTVRTIDARLGNGTVDATSGIQSVINATCAAGGGVVLLPAGTYRVRLPSTRAASALTINCSNIVLRGVGSQSRILFDDALRARYKAVIQVLGAGSIEDDENTVAWAFASDSTMETMSINLVSNPGFAVGDWIVVRNDGTDAFREDHRMDEDTSSLERLWTSPNFTGLTYLRKVVAINGRSIRLDAPIHYALRVRDNARVYRAPALLSEVGLESFAIGMVQNPSSLNAGGTESSHENDFSSEGTTGHQVHANRAVDMDLVRDAWIWDVDSFLPDGNSSEAHLLSIGLQLSHASTSVTVAECDWGRPQYRGGGGNGYLFHLLGNDALVRDSTATNGRHGFIINHAVSGSVFRQVTIRSSRLTDDSHRYLAHANLYDRVVLDGGWLQTVNRGTTSTGAGFTGTQMVYWGTHVQRNHGTARGCAVESAQWGYGYLIGSSAATGEEAKLCLRSFSNAEWSRLDQGSPEDFVEGENMGATLFPHSLHQAQLDLRCAREGLNCSW